MVSKLKLIIRFDFLPSNSVKAFLFGILIIYSTRSHAQLSFPSPSDNPYWIERHGGLWSCSTTGIYGDCSGYFCDCTMPIYYKNDTLIGNTTYNQLFTYGVCSAFIVQGPPPQGCPSGFYFSQSEYLIALIRRDTVENRVYVRIGNQEELLYDFNAMDVGNIYPRTYTNTMQDTLVITDVETMNVNGKQYKKWQLGIKQNGTIAQSGFASVSEGIGCSLGLLSIIMLPFENVDQLLCFSLNELSLYPDSSSYCDKTLDIKKTITSHLTIFPNPAKDYITIELPQNNESCENLITISNTTGKVVLRDCFSLKSRCIDIRHLPAGLYIVQVENKKSVTSKSFVKID